ncbi:MAG: hypothetical protein, partial [Olavius algarvensis Gamma 1 endosymbiont]
NHANQGLRMHTNRYQSGFEFYPRITQIFGNYS